MTEVSLRAYCHEIEGLIEHDQRLDEAIAHCRQVLKSYPKHLDTYRLLGKAYLEGRRYDETVDVFERLLVAVPDDFVAHVGMSIIADERGKLDDAIWHMERAFEVQPSNPAIQGELQRLFGRRDGVEPPKIRLTRGALAQMYVHGQLYAQAISEIRAVLAQDAERADLEVLLAKACYQSGQKTEAADVCARLLSRYSYCYVANALMVDLLAGTGSAESSDEYRKRVIELDPYAAFARDSIMDTSTVPESAVTVEHLDDVVQPVPSGTVRLPGPQAGAPVESPRGGPPPDRDIPPFLRGSSPAEQEPESAGTESEAFPDVSEGDLPEWVRALAPIEEEAADVAADDVPTDVPSWLAPGAAPEAAPTSATGESDVPEWLRDLGTDVGEPVGGDEPGAIDAGAGRQPGGAEASEAQEQSGTRAEAMEAGSSSGSAEDGLAWLQSLAADRGSTAESATTGIAEAAAPEEPLGQVTAEDGSLPEAGGGSAPDIGQADAETSEAASPDWLRSLAEGATFDEPSEPEEEGQFPTESESAPGTATEWPHMTATTPAGEEPSWMSKPAAEDASLSGDAPRKSSDEVEPEAKLPDWLVGLDTKRRADEGTAQTEGTAPWATQEAAPEAEPAPTPEPGATVWRQAEPNVASRPVAEQQTGAAKAVTPVPAEAAPPESAVAAVAEPLPRIQKQTASLLGNAQSEMGRGNIAAALQIYDRLIHKGKSLTDIIRDLRDALYRYPVEVPIWQALGDAYMRANRLQEALDAYTKAEELLR